MLLELYILYSHIWMRDIAVHVEVEDAKIAASS